MFGRVIGGLGLVLHEPVRLLGQHLGQILLGGGVGGVLSPGLGVISEFGVVQLKPLRLPGQMKGFHDVLGLDRGALRRAVMIFFLMRSKSISVSFPMASSICLITSFIVMIDESPTGSCLNQCIWMLALCELAILVHVRQ